MTNSSNPCVSVSDNLWISFTKEVFLQYVKKTIVKLRFRKIDGSERDMICTLCPEVLVRVGIDLNEKKDKEQDSNKIDGKIVVYDLEKKDWRSFYIQNMIWWSEQPNHPLLLDTKENFTENETNELNSVSNDV